MDQNTTAPMHMMATRQDVLANRTRSHALCDSAARKYRIVGRLEAPGSRNRHGVMYAAF